MASLTTYTRTECTDNGACQTLVSGQVASLHDLQKSCGDSRAKLKFYANVGKILVTSEKSLA